MIKKIATIAALILSGCCDESSPDGCTQAELTEIKAKQSADSTPQLVTTQDNVRLYRIWTHEPYADSHWTYFTTPCGDVTAEIEYRSGKVIRQIPSNVNGSGCK